ncbi:zinc ribbon domain-containing protein [Streptosporangium sp. NPDC000396]|uniref:zinc ribbon domain-containing protein n=1 Tax=Streptosporangium sp. NPDC000396 TaxID=3366185 RepID=UPI0036AD7DE0
MGRIHQAYRYALAPTPAQTAALASHCGAARFAFNWGLARVRAALSQREAEKTYGVPEELLTEVPWSLYGLRRAWNTAKGTVAPWWADNSKEAYSSGLDGLARALTNWSASRQGTRAGKPVGFPRFRAKHRAALSCRFTTGAIRLETDRRHVTLPRLGTIRTAESTRKPARAVADTAMAEVRRQLTYKSTWRGGRLVVADRWYPSSKTCSGCGAVKAKLALSERTYACTACGLVLDRDVNAARNLAALAARYEHDVAQSCGETRNARGGAVGPGIRAGHAPAKREPLSRGTLPRQRGSSPILTDKH